MISSKQNDRGSNERWQAEPKRLILGHKWIKRESTYKKGPMNFDFFPLSPKISREACLYVKYVMV